MQSEWPSEIREKYKDTIQFFEETGILKVQTSLSQDPEDFTHPTVLPDHPLLERLVSYTHRSLMHAGVLTTLAQLIEKFWIPKGRRVVRAILRQCIKCKRLTGGKVNPDPALLPPDRIQSCSLSNNWRRSGRSYFLTWWKQSMSSVQCIEQFICN
ncbi:integrase catalytic domain-containing protein [Trichonephila inaurata madagascariensis]|uniref:Integrase catalytic domain-containing protein n=1 Tax=Trichonephila inaurata madagascariensis TaxID=2747483 RepID=A0A8X6IQD1_9ARAC|nr:integrase catalytic domain-containing protein [Trichonephila inaurata madagascariensis]GFY61226.1 integrase catalytic domain-containing protein [Trichonephila inaurata madagascariensis]